MEVDQEAMESQDDETKANRRRTGAKKEEN